MLRFERNDFMVRGTVSSLMNMVNIMIARPGRCTTESIATSMFSCVCHIRSQMLAQYSQYISPYCAL